MAKVIRKCPCCKYAPEVPGPGFALSGCPRCGLTLREMMDGWKPGMGMKQRCYACGGPTALECFQVSVRTCGVRVIVYFCDTCANPQPVADPALEEVLSYTRDQFNYVIGRGYGGGKTAERERMAYESFGGSEKTRPRPKANRTPGVVGEVERREERAAAMDQPRIEGPRVQAKPECDCGGASGNTTCYRWCKAWEA